MGGYDLRFALRLHARRPLLTGLIVATLGLAIGATTTIFTVTYAVILRPLPLHEPDRLVHVFEAYPKGSRYIHGSDRSFISVRPGTFDDWAAQIQSFETIAASQGRGVVISGGTAAESYNLQAVTPRFFETLGAKPLLGRTLAADDFAGEGRRVVVISHDLWRTRFGADPGVLGTLVPIDGADHVIVGVMPAGFYPTPFLTPKLWTPLVFDAEMRGSRVRWGLISVARLKAGVSLEQAQQEMDVISDRLTRAYPEHYDNMCAVVAPMTGYLYGRYERIFAMLTGAVALVLLVACANITSLLLARMTERSRELALRSALGASAGRMVRQLLMENLVLAVAGAIVGVLLARASLPAVLRLLPSASRLPRLDDVRIDGTVLLFAAGVTVIATLLVGLVPVWRSLRAEVVDSLKDAARGTSMGTHANRTGQALIVIEVALTFVLLVGGALLVQSLQSLLRVDAGVNTTQALAMSLIVPAHAYGAYDLSGPNPPRARLFADLERELGAVPGVVSAAVTTSLPLRHGPNPWAMHIEGRAAPPPQGTAYGGAQRLQKTGLYNHGDVSIQRVSTRYFETFGIPLLRGRLFDDRDRADMPGVALINATAADRYFAGEDPIGKTIVIDMTSYFPRFTIVGIVGDSRMNGVDRDVIPQVFWPLAQRPSSNTWLVLRTAGDPAAITASARARLHQLAPDVAIDQTLTMETALAESLWQPRLSATLMGIFGGLAVVLAAAGIYGVFSQFVSLRTQELGVRVALGANASQVAGLVLWRSVQLALCGVAIGMLAALWLGRGLAGQLHGVRAYDPTTLATVAGFVIAVAFFASVVPTIRAIRVDPIIALRQT